MKIKLHIIVVLLSVLLALVYADESDDFGDRLLDANDSYSAILEHISTRPDPEGEQLNNLAQKFDENIIQALRAWEKVPEDEQKIWGEMELNFEYQRNTINCLVTGLHDKDRELKNLTDKEGLLGMRFRVNWEMRSYDMRMWDQGLAWAEKRGVFDPETGGIIFEEQKIRELYKKLHGERPEPDPSPEDNLKRPKLEQISEIKERLGAVSVAVWYPWSKYTNDFTFVSNRLNVVVSRYGIIYEVYWG